MSPATWWLAFALIVNTIDNNSNIFLIVFLLVVYKTRLKVKWLPE